jgi:hypothetical protein
MLAIGRNSLIKIADKDRVEYPVAPLSQIKILPYNERDEWELVTKYSIGNKKKN